MPMKHTSTRELYAYWDKRRGARRAPERNEIEPGEIRRILGDTFILSCNALAGHPFRLAGTRVCALFGGEIKGEPFLGLWRAADRNAVAETIAAVTAEATGVVASAVGDNEYGDEVVLELLLLPLAQRGRTDQRLIGVLAPLTVPYWIGVRPIGPLALGPRRHVGPAIDAARTPSLVPGSEGIQVKNGLLVYDGGRSD
jgi:hypothetical protein